MEEEQKEKEIEMLNEIFARAASDPEFRNMLLREPSSVLDKYGLSEEIKKMILEGLRGMN